MKEIKKMREDELIEDKSLYSLIIDNLYFSYDDKNDIDGLSLKIKKGEKVALLGHNGSGKTTLLKLIDGILPIKSGCIYIDGILLNDKTASNIRKKIGLVFQNPDSQFIGTTVKDDIIFSLENECVNPKDMDKIVLKTLKDVSMKNYIDRETTALSGGQKQKINLANIFALNKEILLLDEAKSMLDNKTRIDIDNLLKEKLESNKDMTLISITHDIEETYMFDRIIVLEAGKIVYDGNKDNLFTNRELLDKLHIKPPFYYELLNQLDLQGNDFKTVEEILDFYANRCK